MGTTRIDNFLENFGCEEEERGLQEMWSGKKIFLRWERLELEKM